MFVAQGNVLKANDKTNAGCNKVRLQQRRAIFYCLSEPKQSYPLFFAISLFVTKHFCRN